MKEIKTSEIISKNLRALMDHNGMTQADLAEKVHTSQVTINRWLNGNMFPSIHKLEELAELFNTTPAMLLSENAELPEPVELKRDPAENYRKFFVHLFGEDAGVPENIVMATNMVADDILTKTRRNTIWLRYGLDDGQYRTLRTISEKTGVSRQGVFSTISTAEARLRKNGYLFYDYARKIALKQAGPYLRPDPDSPEAEELIRKITDNVTSALTGEPVRSDEERISAAMRVPAGKCLSFIPESKLSRLAENGYSDFGSVFMASPCELLKVPGIGRTTVMRIEEMKKEMAGLPAEPGTGYVE